MGLLLPFSADAIIFVLVGYDVISEMLWNSPVGAVVADEFGVYYYN